MKILLAVDGSEASERAVKHVVQFAKALAEPPTLTLLHVDAPLLQAAAAKLGAKAVADYHASNSQYALKDATRILNRAKFAFDTLALIGDPAGKIAATATKQRSDLVVMGSRGQTALKGLLLGSVATRVLARSKVPLTLIR